MFRACMLLVTLWVGLETAFGQEPRKTPDAQSIPAPQRVTPIDTPDYIVGGPLPRPGTREVWQYYGVNRFGRFVPRVIVTPEGAYYYRNGEPYPWVPTNRPGL